MAQKELLVPLNQYLSTGIHIGMIQRLKVMMPYIYKVRQDKLAVFDIQKIDERIRLASAMLAKYEPEEILVVSRKKNGQKPVVKFAEAVGGAHAKWGRFMPGTLTNPNYDGYFEPGIIVVTDPFADRQALLEAFNANVPVIGLCDTYNNPQYVDLIVPLNNKGKKSVALVFWLLAREYLKIRGNIKGDAEYKYSADDFEMPEGENAGRRTEDRNRPRGDRNSRFRGNRDR